MRIVAYLELIVLYSAFPLFIVAALCKSGQGDLKPFEGKEKE